MKRKTCGLMLFLCFVCSNCFATIWQIPSVEMSANSVAQVYKSVWDLVIPMQVITARQIKISAAQTILQLLQSDGLAVQNLTGDGDKLAVNMRGFGGNAAQNSLVLVNGFPLTNPDLGVVRFNQIPVHNVKRIEVIPASLGVLYGDQAVGGVINIITDTAFSRQRYVGFGFGGFNEQMVQAGVSDIYKRQIYYLLNAKYHTTDNYRHHNKSQNGNVDFTVDDHLAHGSIMARYLFQHSYLQYPGALTYQQVQRDRHQVEPGSINDYDQQDNHLLLVNFIRQLQPNWNFKLATEFRKMHGWGKLSNDFTKSRYAIGVIPTLTGAMNVFDTSAFSVSGLRFNQAQYVFDTLGYHSMVRQNIYAVFSKWNFAVAPHWHLLVGARAATEQGRQRGAVFGPWQSFTIHNNVFITSVGLVWNVNHYTKWFLRRAGNYRFPKAGENIDTNTNRPLKAQTGISYESGINLDIGNFIGNFMAYQLNLKHEITAVPIPGTKTTFVENENLPPTVRRGFSMHGKYVLNRRLAVGSTYRYVWARFSAGPNSGNRIPFVAANNISVNTTFMLRNNLSLYAEGLYTGRNIKRNTT